MSDAFSDVVDSDDSDTDDGVTTDTFTDMGVRSTLPDSDETLNAQEYTDEDGNSAEDVDPRKLFEKPSLNEIRYYAREGPFGPTIIQKPVLDAFKHGFEVQGDNTEREDREGRIKSFLDEYKEAFVEAEIKSRRDGLSILLFQVADDASSAAEPLGSSGSHQGFHVFTVDNLSEDLTDQQVAEHTEFDVDQIYVTRGHEHGGVAIVDDISHPRHEEVLGYGIVGIDRSGEAGTPAPNFVNVERCQHFTHGEFVDGPLDSDVRGSHVGESILTPVLQPLKGMQMGFWALKTILYRYSAPIHAVEPPDSWGQSDWDEARENLDNLSMASDAILPPGSELNVAEGTTEFDPEPTFEVLLEATAAGTEFTKPVLIGTQSGTLSGSETDLKAYFNQVQRLRTGRFERKFREAVQKVSQYDQQTIPRVAGTETFDIEWGPLFKPSEIEQAEGMVSVITAVSNGIKNYVLTPEEARSILQEEWAEFDADIDLEELSEDDWDSLDRINMNEAGRGASDNEPDAEARENPRIKNGGGQPEGQSRESSQPSADDGAFDDLDT